MQMLIHSCHRRIFKTIHDDVEAVMGIVLGQ